MWKEIEGDYWEPTDKEDEVEGIFIKKEDKGNGSFNYTLQNGPEKQIIVKGTTITDDRFKKIKEGSKVKVIYKGERPTTKGNALKLFKVLVDEEEKS